MQSHGSVSQRVPLSDFVQVVFEIWGNYCLFEGRSNSNVFLHSQKLKALINNLLYDCVIVIIVNRALLQLKSCLLRVG